MPAASPDHPPTAVPKFAFDMEASPDGKAFEMFRASSLPHFTITPRDATEIPSFYVHAVTYPLPRMILTRVRGGPMVMHRGPGEIAADPNPPLLNMHIQLAGDSDGTVGGRPLRTRPGDVLFYDYARELVCSNAAFECITLLMSRDRAPPAFLRPGAHGAKLAGGSGAARLLAATAQATHTHLAELTLAQADLALQSLADLAGRLLDEHLTSTRGEPASALATALAFIDERLDDDKLATTELATHLGMSRSALYRVFETLGGVENAIRQRRLDRAMRVILTGREDSARKARAGFNNEEQFARAFQARFGARPSRYREVVNAKDDTWLGAQARRMGYVSLEAWIDSLERGPAA